MKQNSVDSAARNYIVCFKRVILKYTALETGAVQPLPCV